MRLHYEVKKQRTEFAKAADFVLFVFIIRQSQYLNNFSHVYDYYDIMNPNGYDSERLADSAYTGIQKAVL